MKSKKIIALQKEFGLFALICLGRREGLKNHRLSWRIERKQQNAVENAVKRFFISTRTMNPVVSTTVDI